MSVTDSLCISQTDCFCQRQSVLVTDSLCQTENVFVCQSVSLSKTLQDHPWPDFNLFIHDFPHNLSVRFQFVRDLNPINPNFVDP